jgi:hypothetical protein
MTGHLFHVTQLIRELFQLQHIGRTLALRESRSLQQEHSPCDQNSERYLRKREHQRVIKFRSANKSNRSDLLDTAFSFHCRGINCLRKKARIQ